MTNDRNEIDDATAFFACWALVLASLVGIIGTEMGWWA